MRLFGIVLAAGLCANSVSADTIRYSFDVIDSTIGFGKVTGDGGVTIAAQTQAYNDVVAAFHVHAASVGQTGAIQIDASISNLSGGLGYFDGITCLSGFLCDDPFINRQFSRQDGRVEQTISNGQITDSQLFTDSGYISHWSFDLAAQTGSLNMFDDGAIYGSGTLNGTLYSYETAYASYTFSNVTRTPLAPVPLPASGLLLGACLLALFGVRRTAR